MSGSFMCVFFLSCVCYVFERVCLYGFVVTCWERAGLLALVRGVLLFPVPGYPLWRDFVMSLSDDKQADVIDAFNTTSRYLDDILNINNVYFDNMVRQIYPSELQLNKANASDTEAAFLDLHLSISNDIVSIKIYDKRGDFDFEIVNFPFLDGDVPRSTSY